MADAQESIADGNNDDLDDQFNAFMRRIFHINPFEQVVELNRSSAEYFGVHRVFDPRTPRRKLWHIYHCQLSNRDMKLEKIYAKYGGRENVTEIFCKPVYSGAGFTGTVKTRFAEMNWIVTGNFLEPPPKSHYKEEMLIRLMTQIYHMERQRKYNYSNIEHIRRNTALY